MRHLGVTEVGQLNQRHVSSTFLKHLEAQRQ